MEITKEEIVNYDTKITEMEKVIRYNRRSSQSDAAATAKAEIKRINDLRYENGSWERYAIYPNGKVHDGDLPCTGRVYNNSHFAPKLSGTSIADVIAKYKTSVCSRCFKDAPVR